MATLKDRATKAVDRAAKKLSKQLGGSIDSVVKETEHLRGQLEKRVEETSDQTRIRAARLALSVVDFEKTTYDHIFKVIAQVQQKSEKAISGMLHEADWLPGEGKAVVDEWVHLLRTSRHDFNKTVGKSFDLITEYLKRVEQHAKTGKKKPAAKKKAPAKKKAAAKKKAPAKKKAAA